MTDAEIAELCRTHRGAPFYDSVSRMVGELDELKKDNESLADEYAKASVAVGRMGTEEHSLADDVARVVSERDRLRAECDDHLAARRLLADDLVALRDGGEVKTNLADSALIVIQSKLATLRAACELWDQGFVEGEQFTPEQFRRWINANRRAAREALAKTAP